MQQLCRVLYLISQPRRAVACGMPNWSPNKNVSLKDQRVLVVAVAEQLFC